MIVKSNIRTTTLMTATKQSNISSAADTDLTKTPANGTNNNENNNKRRHHNFPEHRRSQMFSNIGGTS